MPLRLPYGVSELFQEWLTVHYPARKDKILNLLREIRGGRLNDPNFGSRMHGSGAYADQLEALFRLSANKAGLNAVRPKLNANSFRRPSSPQLSLFA